MKTLCIFLLFFVSTTVAQTPGWTDLIETNLTVGENDYDIFTNHYGNHIIVQESSALKYFNMDVYGDATSAYSPITLENSAVVSPSITGNKDTIYVVYRKSSESSIKTQYSLDGGENWSTLGQVPSNSNASLIESVFSKDNLHVTFQIGTTVYHTYKYVRDGTNWTTPFAVCSTFVGITPRINVWNAGSDDIVYITYTDDTNNRLHWRRLIVGDDWDPIRQTTQAFGFVPLNLGFAVDNTVIYSFYKPSTTNVFEWNVREVEDNNFIGLLSSNNNEYVNKFFATTTANNNPYSAAWSTEEDFENSIVRIGFNGDENLLFDLIHTEEELTEVDIVNLSSAENDVHVIWKDNLGNNSGNNLGINIMTTFPLFHKI